MTSAVEVGDLIGDNYVVSRRLGEGSMGEVILARDTSLERDVAIKLVSQRIPKLIPHLAKRFREEALAMASVDHPNVLPIYSYGEHGGQPYFVMQYVRGGTLEDVMRREGPLPVSAALGIFEQIAAGLDAIHERGLLHRDVKPANMLIGARYQVYLADFGVSEPSQSGPLKLAGSPSFIAPEVADRRDVPSELRYLSDVYALAICIYNALTGDVPFHGNTLDALLDAHREQPPPEISSLRADLPERFDDIFASALAKDPRERVRGAGLLVEQLRDAHELWQGKQAQQAGRQVLAVDDDLDMRELYRVVFEAAFDDVEVRVAEDGLIALEAARASRPDLLLVDLNMPALDGVSLCAALRDDRRLATVPIIVISASLTADVRRTLSALGIRHMMSKPVAPRELVSTARALSF